MNEQEALDLRRTRVLLAGIQGEQERLAASLDRVGLTDFSDRADWLIARRSADEQLAWRRHWSRLGIRNAEPQPPRFDRPASLSAQRPKHQHPIAIDPDRALAVALDVYDHLPPEQKRQWATARQRAVA